MKLIVAITIIALACVPRVNAQSLDVTPLVRGQPATFTVTNAPFPGNAVLLATIGGSGAGTCYPQFGLCLGILEPILVVADLPVAADGTAALQAIVPTYFPEVLLSFQAVTVVWSPVLAITATPAVDIPVENLSTYDDTFDVPTLDPEWSILHPALLASSISGSALALTPTAGGPAVIWFNDDEGPLVYRRITGDFIVETTVHVSSASSPLLPAPLQYRLSGILIRDPAGVPGNRNGVHVAVGCGTFGEPSVVEDKTTTASQSVFTMHAIPTQDREIRLERIGATISVSHRTIGATQWTTVGLHAHPELPATVDVGMMVYSYSAAPDITGRFESIRFSLP